MSKEKCQHPINLAKYCIEEHTYICTICREVLYPAKFPEHHARIRDQRKDKQNGSHYYF